MALAPADPSGTSSPPSASATSAGLGRRAAAADHHPGRAVPGSRAAGAAPAGRQGQRPGRAGPRRRRPARRPRPGRRGPPSRCGAPRRTPGCRRAGRRSTPARRSSRAGSATPSSDSTASSGRASARPAMSSSCARRSPARPRALPSRPGPHRRHRHAARRAEARRPRRPAGRRSRPASWRAGPPACGHRSSPLGMIFAYQIRWNCLPNRSDLAWSVHVEHRPALRPHGIPTSYELTHLQALEAEAIHIIREVAAEFERPVLLFSGGKDSAVMLHLAVKAFAPARLPFPRHARRHRPQLPRGHRLPRPAGRRARRAPGRGQRAGRHRRRAGWSRTAGPRATRNRLQTVPLLDAIEEHRFDAVFGGARRDEEKARAKERVFSFRDDFGQWDPKNQRPELWNLYNGRHRKGEHIRVFPHLQLDRARHLAVHRRRGHRAAEHLLRPHAGRCSSATACGWPSRPGSPSPTARRLEERMVRFRTVGDATCTGRGRVGGRRRGHDHRGDGGDPHHRAGRHPRRRPHQRGGHGRPQAGTSEPRLQRLARSFTAYVPANAVESASRLV